MNQQHGSADGAVTIADDYSDPFDAKNDLKSKTGKGESAGYMEPYEAQRIMTELEAVGETDGFSILCLLPPVFKAEHGQCSSPPHP
ncbi:SH2 domain-containing adapter protein B-like protein [Cricetulus griseus]|nr:SH2 domain-containing adapter protein B-like protein [Cricetulus griseus]